MRFRAIERGDADVVDEFAPGRDRDIDVGAVVAVLQLNLAVLAVDLDAAGIVDLLDRERDARADRIAGRHESAGLRGDDADLDRIVGRDGGLRRRREQGAAGDGAKLPEFH